MKTRIFLITLLLMVFGFATKIQAQTQDIKFTNKQQNYSKTVTYANINCTSPVTVQLSVSAIWSAYNPDSKYIFTLNGTIVNMAYGSNGNGYYNINLKTGVNFFQIEYVGPLDRPSYGMISILRVNNYPIISNNDTQLAGGPAS